MVAKIRVRWPDGPICGICFYNAAHTNGQCPTCGIDRLLPGRNTAGADICRDCAGITTNMTCSTCGTEAQRFRHGNCIRCVLRADLQQILKPHTPPDLRLKRLVAILVGATRPESIYTWMRGSHAKALLAGIGSREINLSHDAFDALPPSKAVEYLREVLTHHQMIPARDRQLAAFERWLDARIINLGAEPGIQSPIEQFARWHHLKRLRGKPSVEDNMNFAVRSAKQEITETGRFLTWLKNEHQCGHESIGQSHVDEYFATGTTTRYSARNFIIWLIKTKQINTIHVPRRAAETTPMLSQTKRRELILACMTSAQAPMAYRIAGLILLLYAHPCGKIVAMKTTAIEPRPDGLYLHIGIPRALIPAQIADLFWTYLNDRPNQQTTNTDSQWLFPGTLAGQHIHPDTLMKGLRDLGIDIAATRNSTLRDLVQQLPPTLLANTLGYSNQVVHKHAAAAGVPMSNYVQLKK